MSGDPIAFVDLETTALDRDLLQVWEVALIAPLACEYEGEEDTYEWEEYVWHLPVDLSRADPMSLSMNGFTERYNNWDTPAHERPAILAEFAQEFARLTRGLTLVGANPAFDERALWKLLRENGECPLWHYRPICVETLAAGYLVGRVAFENDPEDNPSPPTAWSILRPPWKHADLIGALGIDISRFDRHSAIGDARLVKEVYEKVYDQ